MVSSTATKHHAAHRAHPARPPAATTAMLPAKIHALRSNHRGVCRHLLLLAWEVKSGGAWARPSTWRDYTSSHHNARLRSLETWRANATAEIAALKRRDAELSDRIKALEAAAAAARRRRRASRSASPRTKPKSRRTSRRCARRRTRPRPKARPTPTIASRSPTRRRRNASMASRRRSVRTAASRRLHPFLESCVGPPTTKPHRRVPGGGRHRNG